jgi:hypothetical protein
MKAVHEGFLLLGFLRRALQLGAREHGKGEQTLTKPPRAAAAESQPWLPAGTHYQHSNERFSAVLTGRGANIPSRGD